MGAIEAGGSEGLLAPISTVEIPNIANIYEYGKGKYSVGWYITPRGIFYRMDLAGFELTDWNDLWDERLRGKVATPEATFAGGQFIVLAAVLAGGSEYNIDPGFEYLKKLKPNIAVFFKTDSEAIKFLQAGEAAVTAASLLPNVYPLLGKESKYRFCVPKTPILISVDQIAVVEGPNKALATKFVDYMLGSEAQEAHCFTLGALPINKTAKLPKDVADMTPPMDVVYNTDFDEVNKHLSAWTERWNREIKRR
jgi:putative spermidine/putrescine transport system substrate-binding protein